jgi:hypothetical protein
MGHYLSFTPTLSLSMNLSLSYSYSLTPLSLSMALRRLGFQSGSQGASSGAARERESSYESVLVVCIVGGISYVEVAQVQSVLSQHAASVHRNGGSEVLTRVVLVSTSAVSPEDVLSFVSQRT